MQPPAATKLEGDTQMIVLSTLSHSPFVALHSFVANSPLCDFVPACRDENSFLFLSVSPGAPGLNSLLNVRVFQFGCDFAAPSIQTHLSSLKRGVIFS